MIITEGESTLMKTIHRLKPCYCVSIREKLQAVIHRYERKEKF